MRNLSSLKTETDSAFQKFIREFKSEENNEEQNQNVCERRLKLEDERTLKAKKIRIQEEAKIAELIMIEKELEKEQFDPVEEERKAVELLEQQIKHIEEVIKKLEAESVKIRSEFKMDGGASKNGKQVNFE